MTSLAFDAILGAASAAAAAILAIAWIVSTCARSIGNEKLPLGDRRLVARYNLLYITIAFVAIGAVLMAVRPVSQPPEVPEEKVAVSAPQRTALAAAGELAKEDGHALASKR